MYNRRLTWAITCAALFALLSTALPAAAQMVASGPNAAPSVPYTVEFRTTRVQTLANGATITRETKEIRARDSQGRSMTAITLIPATDGERSFTNFHVNLPDRTIINWTSNSKRAQVIHLQPLGSSGCWTSVPDVGSAGSFVVQPAPAAPLAPAAAGGSGGGMGGGGVAGAILSQAGGAPFPRQALGAPIQSQHEELGTDTILGVEVQGARMTRTTPAGRIGNDEPLLRTEEIWSAPSLGGLVLREITDDPRTGKSTREAVSLDLSEPDPAVFQPPEGYEIVDQELHEVPCQPAH
jgi:hypothetical protein